MDLSEARKRLQYPLEFGNKEQIEAMSFIEKAEEALAILIETGMDREKCAVCDGIDFHNHECECGDTHECGKCNGTGYCDQAEKLKGFSDAIVEAAVQLRAERGSQLAQVVLDL